MSDGRSFVRTGARTEWVRSIPKIELHCHLLGTIRKNTMRDIARANGARTQDLEIEEFYVRGEKPVGVLRIFRELEAHILCEPRDLHRIAYEYVEGLVEHNVRHTEVFWNPTGSLVHTSHSYRALQDAVVAGLRDAQSDHGVSSVLIPSIDREASPKAATELVTFMINNRDERVLGLGIDYRENDGPPELFTDAYAMARNAGFRTTAHAGEFGMPWPNVLTALDALGVDRLDHAYTMLDNPDLVQRCVDSGTIVTVVPSNSYYLRTLAPDEWSDQHPIRRMGAAGLRIHPNSDDPAFHLINPTQAWESMIADFGYAPSDLRSFMLNGISGAWIDEEKRLEWTKSWSAEFDSLLANMPADESV